MSSEHEHEVTLHIKQSKLFLFNTTKYSSKNYHLFSLQTDYYGKS